MGLRNIQSVSRVISKRTGLETMIQYATSSDFRLGKALTKELISIVPKDELKQIERRYLNPRRPGLKYLRLDRWMSIAVQRAIKLELHKSPPKRILDLGCGTGYFMAAARHLGHDVLGLDLDEVEIFNELTELLKLIRVVQRINAFEPLPDMGVPFDMITAFMVRFNILDVYEHWSFEEWRYFLDDCKSRLNPGGQIYLSLNKGKRGDFEFLSDETAAQIRQYPGATVSDNKAIIRVQV
jgi:2-polyprenyl-3-methyl-5-hydroxy-6-metoxy-1,4-benzoquinol methylase